MVPAGNFANAASVGAKTVNGPEPFKVSAKPAAWIKLLRVLKLLVAAKFATISLLALTAFDLVAATVCFFAVVFSAAAADFLVSVADGAVVTELAVLSAPVAVIELFDSLDDGDTVLALFASAFTVALFAAGADFEETAFSLAWATGAAKAMAKATKPAANLIDGFIYSSPKIDCHSGVIARIRHNVRQLWLKYDAEMQSMNDVDN